MYTPNIYQSSRINNLRILRDKYMYARLLHGVHIGLYIENTLQAPPTLANNSKGIGIYSVYLMASLVQY